ncbi:MAG: nuclear transport factor 2 family protein [Candidatus Solibacter sp.]|nr:nuclear transport factor 2 family protein [Candidatus Solibacter sp.]
MSLRLFVALLILFPCWPQQSVTRADPIRQLIADYAAAVDAADVKLAGRIWDNSPEVSFIHPLGQAHGWDQVKAFFTDTMGGMFSERKLMPRDIKVHVYRDSAWSEFNWHFTATQKTDGAQVQSDGRETQIYRKAGNRWVLVHVHYSDMPASR